MKNSEPDSPQADALRPLLVALGCASLGFLPVLVGQTDPLLWLAWISIIALPTGLFTGASGLAVWPYGLATPGVWMIALVCLEAASGGTLPEPAWAAIAWTGLFAVGFTLGACFGARRWRALGLGLCVSGLLCVLPLLGGGPASRSSGRSLGQLAPAAAAIFMDCSPMTLVMESAGVDWMRHRAVYDAAGTEWFSDRRQPYRGKLAAPAVLLVGYLGSLLTRSRARAIWSSQHSRR